MPHVPVSQRREQLLAAAWRVLSSRGLAAATTRAICAEAGLAQGAFHYCFASRDELLREVAIGLLPDEISAADAVIDRSGTLAQSIERALGAYWALVEADPGAHQVLYEITTASLRDRARADPYPGTPEDAAADPGPHHPDLRDVAELQYARYLDGARQILRRIASVRGIEWQRPPDVLARQVVTVLDGLTLHFAVDRDTPAARAALAAFAEDLAAVGKRPRRSATSPPKVAPRRSAASPRKVATRRTAASPPKEAPRRGR